MTRTTPANNNTSAIRRKSFRGWADSVGDIFERPGNGSLIPDIHRFGHGEGINVIREKLNVAVEESDANAAGVDAARPPTDQRPIRFPRHSMQGMPSN